MIRRTLAILAVALVAAPAAHAVPVDGGTANFRQGTRGTSLPIRAGHLINGEGVLKLKRRLTIGRGPRKVVLRALEIDLRPGGAVTALVDGLRQVVFEVDTADALIGTNPTRIRIRRVRLFTAGALDGLDRKVLLGVAAEPRYLTLAGGQTLVQLDQAFRDALTAAQVTPGANEGAVIDSNGAAQFPISRGRLFLGRKGRSTIDHGGGLTFSQMAGPALRFTDFLLNTRDGIVSGRIEEPGPRVELMTVDLEALVFTPGAATIGASAAALTAAGAEALNAALGSSFTEGTAFGTIAVEAVIQ